MASFRLSQTGNLAAFAVLLAIRTLFLKFTLASFTLRSVFHATCKARV